MLSIGSRSSRAGGRSRRPRPCAWAQIVSAVALDILSALVSKSLVLTESRGNRRHALSNAGDVARVRS